VVWLYGDRGRLWLFVFSSEFKPLTPERAGSELQSPRTIRSPAAQTQTGRSKLLTADTQ
ncbi:hypothetical protein M9458_000336, partial [Cirrhinus mrigala]